MAGRRNPFEEIEELMNRMSRQFEESMGGPDLGELAGGGGVAVDVADRGDEFAVTADLPGYRPEDVEVSLRGERLRIEAERAEESEAGDGDDEQGRYIRKERRRESASRSIALPEEVDEAGTSAQFRNGVLTVTLPKANADDEGPHRIDVS